MKKLLKNKKGFTLVELIIVIAILAILAAILIPAFGNVTKQAHESAAKSNARNDYTEQVVLELEDAVTNGATADISDIYGTGTSGNITYYYTQDGGLSTTKPAVE